LDAYEWSPPTSGRIVAGADALARLPGLLSDLDIRRAIVVTSPSMARSPVFAVVCEQIGERLIGVFPTVAAHAPMADVRELKDMAGSFGADGYVAVGGSSVLDAMKAAVWLDLAIVKRQAVAIPAMFGGAEVTPLAGVTKDGEKTGLNDERIVPDAVVLDPRVPASLPAGLAHGSVANALAHCVEGLVASDASPMSDAFYLRALALIQTGVGQLAEQRMAALRAFQTASVMAALPRVRMAAAHAFVHVLSPRLGVSHAIAPGVLCRTMMSFTAPAVQEQHQLIAATVSPGELSAAAALTAVTALLDRIGVPRGLYATGVRREHMSLVADAVGNPNNPRPIQGRDELLRVLDHAWSGVLPKSW
jgi:alcohol dehydrogenase class IV